MRNADDIRCQAPRCRAVVPPGSGITVLGVRLCRRCWLRYCALGAEAGHAWLGLPPPEAVEIERGHPLADAPFPHVEPERAERRRGRRRAVTVDVFEEGALALSRDSLSGGSCGPGSCYGAPSEEEP